MHTSAEANQIRSALQSIDPGLLDLLQVLVETAIKVLVRWLASLFD